MKFRAQASSFFSSEHKHLMLTCMGTRLVKQQGASGEQLRLVLEALNLIRDSRQCPAVMRALPMRLWCWPRTWNLVVTLRPVYTVWFHSPEFCWTTNPWPCILLFEFWTWIFTASFVLKTCFTHLCSMKDVRSSMAVDHSWQHQVCQLSILHIAATTSAQRSHWAL